MTITTPLFDRGFSTPGDGQVYADLGPGQDRATLTSAMRGFTTAQVRTLGGFIAAQQSPIGTIVNLLYVLLALCVVISLFGIVNTLALSVTERTREIGMLRAIGMTRTQLRRMIGIESEFIALIGAVTGIVAGLLLAGLTALALSAWSVGFSVPWAVLAILIVGAVLAGAAAGLGPARRAARLDPAGRDFLRMKAQWPSAGKGHHARPQAKRRHVRYHRLFSGRYGAAPRQRG